MDENIEIIIADTSVLINFLKIDRLDLIKNYPGQFLITEHVIEEITHYYSDQQYRLNMALADHLFLVIKIDHLEELKLFSHLQENGRLGAGECSAIACAIHRKYCLAMDDIRAGKQAKQISPDLKILTTQDIIMTLITNQSITSAQANNIKEEWQNNHKFKLKIKSFDEVVS